MTNLTLLYLVCEHMVANNFRGRNCAQGLNDPRLTFVQELDGLIAIYTTLDERSLCNFFITLHLGLVHTWPKSLEVKLCNPNC